MSVITIVYFPLLVVCDFYGPQFNNLLLTDMKWFLSSCTFAFGVDSNEFIIPILLLIELFII